MNPPFCPFIRDADFAARPPWLVRERRLLDYLLVLVGEGECVWTVDGVEHRPRVGEFCLVRPSQRVVLQGLSSTITPYAHFDLVWNARRDESFATRPGQLDLEAYRHLLQPPLPVLSFISTVFAPPEGEINRSAWRDLKRARGWEF